MSDVMSFSAWMLHSLANGLQPLMVSAICGGGLGGDTGRRGIKQGN